ncbi:hypothetical protein N7490_000841 [Penicillium lividum]|nr:hypothetical protein N7490_000841 [Penicillium lividum]
MPSQNTAMPKIFLDTDPGIDEVLAILFALAAQPNDVEILLLSVTFGNIDVQRYQHGKTTNFALSTEKNKKPVIAVGASVPLADQVHNCDGFYGRDGLGGVHTSHQEFSPPEEWCDLFCPTSAGGDDDSTLPFRASQEPAHKEILKILKSHPPDTVTLVAIGPLTNYAMAASEDLDTFLCCKELVFMGGAVDLPGNTTPAAEANVYADAYAAAFIFALTSPDPFSTIQMPSYLPILSSLKRCAPSRAHPDCSKKPPKRLALTIFPLDITTKHILYRKDFDHAIADSSLEGSPLAQWLSVCVTSLYDKIVRQKPLQSLAERDDSRDTIQLHDPLCIWGPIKASCPTWIILSHTTAYAVIGPTPRILTPLTLYLQYFPKRHQRSGATTLGVAMVLAIYLIKKCTTSPNPSTPQRDQQIKDRIGSLLGPGSRITIMRSILVSWLTYHTLVTVLPSYTPEFMMQVCPNGENLNPALFEWSLTTKLALAMMYLGSAVRLMAYSGLGQFFSFHLTPPERLVTSGIYRWVQHPSYSGILFLIAGSFFLFVRWDAAFACWIPKEILMRLDGWGVPAATAAMGLEIFMFALRMRDEEEMLRRKFGRQWEEWHAKTKRAAGIVQLALENGYRHVDAALVYGNEKEVGQGIAAAKISRSSLWVTSKLWNDAHKPAAVRPALEKTLHDLGIEYLDVYLVHWPIAFKPDTGSKIVLDNVPILETWWEMESLVRDGLVRQIGVSNFNKAQLEQLLRHARIWPTVHEFETHPFLHQQEFVDWNLEQGLRVIAYSPLGNMNPIYQSSATPLLNDLS